MGHELRVVVWMKWWVGAGKVAQVSLWRNGHAAAEMKLRKVRLVGIGFRE